MELEKKTNVSLLLDFYAPMLSCRQAEIMQLYYGDDLSLAEVSDITGITRQGVRDAIKKSETILFDCEKRLGLSTKYDNQKKAMSEINEALKGFGVPDEMIEKIADLF